MAYPPNQESIPSSVRHHAGQNRNVFDTSQTPAHSEQQLSSQYTQPYITQFPPAYVPLGQPGPDQYYPPLANHHPLEQPGRGPPNTQFMVYPPPPPAPSMTESGSHRSSQSPMNSSSARSTHVQLPSMGTWAPPSYMAYDHPPSPSHWQQPAKSAAPLNDSQERDTSSSSRTKRQPSDEDEVEAGMTLAGLGFGLTQEGGPVKDVKKEFAPAPTRPTSKRQKKEDSKKGEKDNRKSCSECRRLKAKCDRVFPCSNCRRRGCALVCPDGDLSCMQGKRLVLASTEQLHERIAQLEAALSQAQAKATSVSHPLLAPQYLDGGFVNHPPPPLVDDSQAATGTSTEHQSPSVTSSLIKLEDGSPNGPTSSTANSVVVVSPKHATERSNTQGRMSVESLLLDANKAAPEGKREDEWVGENAAPAMIVGNCGAISTVDKDEHRRVVEQLKKILRIVPSREKLREKADRFFETSTWYNSMLKRDEFYSVYEQAVFAPTPQNPITPHKLACVLMVLTLDAYFDLSTPEDGNPSTAEYWEGAQQCFDTRFGWAASVAGVQALALATLFVGLGWRGARASNFYWLRMMTSAAQQLGLHKDPHHSLPEDERDFRRRVFWDAYTVDCLMSINHGQRTAIPLENVETLMPSKSALELHKMKYEYMRTVKTSVINIGCQPDTAPASWEQISAVDRLIMQYDVKYGPELHCPALSTSEPTPLNPDPLSLDVPSLVRSTTSMCHFKAMMFLYRPSLRRLISHARSLTPGKLVTFTDQEKHTISMTYSACRSINRISLFMARSHPRLSARCWIVWVQTFSAAVSIAALAIWCGPYLEQGFIPSAYNELSEACVMIRENGSRRSQGVLSLLPVLQSLVANRFPQVIGKTANDTRISVEGEDMLFALLGGQVDRGVSPPQGSLMNPPLSLNAPGIQGQLTSTFNYEPKSHASEAHARAHAQAQAEAQARAQMNMQQAAQAQQNAQQQNNAAPVKTEYGAGASMPLSASVASFETTWPEHMVAVPLVRTQPPAFPLDGIPAMYRPNEGLGGVFNDNMVNGPGGQPRQQQSQQQAQQQQQHHQQQQQHSGTPAEVLPDDLWARFQSFYEPTPAYWGQSVGAVPTGYVDYSGMVMGGM